MAPIRGVAPNYDLQPLPSENPGCATDIRIYILIGPSGVKSESESESIFEAGIGVGVGVTLKSIDSAALVRMHVQGSLPDLENGQDDCFQTWHTFMNQ